VSRADSAVTTLSRTLLVGGDPRAGCAHRSVRDLGEERLDRQLFEEVVLQTALEDLDDPWSCLRVLRQWVDARSIVTLSFGRGGSYSLSVHAVECLLRLTAFEPVTVARAGGGFLARSRPVCLEAQPLGCSVIVPCRNEAENIEPLLRRLPPLGRHTEIIFVDGDSTDGTRERIRSAMLQHADRDIKLLHQVGGRGKASAVFQGFAAAREDILIILDADMTVAPEDLPRFVLALSEGVTDVANGNRVVYPMEHGAMPAMNRIGNHIFAHALSALIGTPIGDTLCGTKAIRRTDWLRVDAVRARLGNHDPWGDFDILLGSAACGLRILDVPVRYWARSAGESKMRPIEHGYALTRTCLEGLKLLAPRRLRRR
jgi:hypothetical protein